jgi:outer membrane murein-binding lipoprotein Lpp
MIDFSLPMQGIEAAEQKFEKAAGRIARAPDQGSPDVVDLSAEMVNLLESRNQVAANVKVAQVGDRMAKQMLDVLA